MFRRTLAVGFGLALLLGPGLSANAQQNPLDPMQSKGKGVSGTFEGWYENPDGTYTLSFGYMNRNSEQVLHIPPGEHNSVEPGEADQGQPTVFTPRRSYGVFTVTVPPAFGPQERVTWTLEANGERFTVEGGLLDSYETQNLYSHGADRYPPVLVLDGRESRGPNGARIGPVMARVGEPLGLEASAWDEQGHAVTLRWYKYRGEGEVTFEEFATPLGEGSNVARTAATFSEPGEYTLYVRADHSDTSVNAAGLEQCCWTNGYIDVTVER